MKWSPGDSCLLGFDLVAGVAKTRISKLSWGLLYQQDINVLFVDSQFSLFIDSFLVPASLDP